MFYSILDVKNNTKKGIKTSEAKIYWGNENHFV